MAPIRLSEIAQVAELLLAKLWLAEVLLVEIPLAKLLLVDVLPLRKLQFGAKPVDSRGPLGRLETLIQPDLESGDPLAMHQPLGQAPGLRAIPFRHRGEQTLSRIRTLRVGRTGRTGHGGNPADRSGVNQVSLRSSRGRINRNSPAARAASTNRQVPAVIDP